MVVVPAMMTKVRLASLLRTKIADRGGGGGYQEQANVHCLQVPVPVREYIGLLLLVQSLHHLVLHFRLLFRKTKQKKKNKSMFKQN